ncbi:hypothetical protein BUE80_DR009607 [Diplocarpon rosae]|nr:hypothetical protein BUE80_DR009607 [Diplocarpon rosae]
MRVQYLPIATLAWSAIATLVVAQRRVLNRFPVTPTVDAKLGYDCLTSVPLHVHDATQLVRSLYSFIEFQTTIEYLKKPPLGYPWPPVDLRAGFDALLSKIQSGVFKTEHEFQFQLSKLMSSAHDTHLQFLPDLLFKAISFRRPLPLVSVSLDGVSSPKVYAYHDILLSRKSSFAPSALALIDGTDASSYLEGLSQFGDLQDPDALYNMMFFNPGFAARDDRWLGKDSLFSGWEIMLTDPGLFGGSLGFGCIYPGPNTRITFENGTDLVVENKAVIFGDFTGVTDGESFYQIFCNPLSSRPPAIPLSAPPEPTYILNGYPVPRITSTDRAISGYFLPNSNVAVLAIPNFEVASTEQFQKVVEGFLVSAQANGKEKLIIDLSTNGGGNLLMAYEVFRQLFPGIVQHGNSRYRQTPALVTIAKKISNIFPRGFNPFTSSDEFLLRLWTMALNFRLDYNVRNKPFKSFSEKFLWPLRQYNGDSFTNIIRWNLNDPLITSTHPLPPPPASSTSTDRPQVNDTYGVGIEITGYGSRRGFAQPFAASDIVLVHDGFCSSACAIFDEFMRIQAGVESIAFGGRPSPEDGAATPMIQGVGGTKGVLTYTYQTLGNLAKSALMTPCDFMEQMFLSSLTNSLPQQRSKLMQTPDASVNVRDSIRTANLKDGTPSQFIYDPADCRLFYTPAMMENVTAIWYVENSTPPPPLPRPQIECR